MKQSTPNWTFWTCDLPGCGRQDQTSGFLQRGWVALTFGFGGGQDRHFCTLDHLVTAIATSGLGSTP